MQEAHKRRSMTLTTVHHIDTGESFSYTLSPDQAVIAAYEQRTCGNWNTWLYLNPNEYKGYRRTKFGHVCNGYWAKAQVKGAGRS